MVPWSSVLVLAVLGCSVDCEEARDKLEQCSPKHDTFVAPIINRECSEDDQCVAECVLDAPCDLIRADLGGLDDPNQPVPEGLGRFNRCVLACAG